MLSPSLRRSSTSASLPTPVVRLRARPTRLSPTPVCRALLAPLLNALTAAPAPYPSFDLYPLPFFNPQTGMVDTNSHAFSQYSNNQPPSPQIGLIQPSSGFVHHGYAPSSPLSKSSPLSTAGLTARKSPNFAWPALLASMDSVRCGVTASNAALYLW